MTLMTPTRAKLSLLVAIFVAASCSSVDARGSGPTSEPTATLVPTSTTEAEPLVTTTNTTATTEVDLAPTLDDFRRMLDRTMLHSKLRFFSVTFVDIPGATDDVVGVRTGSLDLDTLAGLGTRSFTRQNLNRLEIVPEEATEFRFVDDVFWTYDPAAQPPRWQGYRVNELEDGGAALLSQIDAGPYLDLLVAATIEVESVDVLTTDVDEWVLRVRADDLLDLLVLPDVALQAIGESAAASGLEAEVHMTVGENTFISDFYVDLSEWWANALSLGPSPEKGRSVLSLRVVFETWDYPLTGVAPCQEPIERVENDVAFLECAS